MNTKKLAILIVFTTLLIFSVVSRIFFNDFQDGWNAYENKDYETARKLWTPLAEQGDSKAQFFLGFMHDMGFGVPEDDQEAIKWYQLAAEQGNSRAQLFTGFAYDYGRGVPEDDQEALKWYQLAEKQGYYQARANIVKLEELVEKNVPQALKGLIDDAEKGIAEAQYTLGVMYANGQGVSQNHKEAAKWYGLAAAQGYTAKTNIYNLAKKNVPQALKVLMGDAEKGIVDAQYTLGMMYANGQGVPQDYKEAFKWYRLVAEQGTALEETTEDKLKKKNIPQALKFLTNDAENGVVDAQIDLGVMYANGQYVPQDDRQSAKWYRLAAENGDSRAQIILSVMYAKGQGVPQSDQKAVKWLRFSMKERVAPEKTHIYNLAKKNVSSAIKILIDDAENGVVEAQNYLGTMYANGQGVPRDYVLAHMWYNLSGLQGHKAATAQINLVERKMSPEQIEKAQEMVRDWTPRK